MFRPLNTFCILLLVCLWTGCVLAAEASPTQNTATPAAQPMDTREGPVMQVAEPTFDFGEAMETEEISHDFIVKNTGKTVLEIEKVSPG